MAQDALSFLHDSNAHRNPQILKLLQRHGAAGYGQFWLLVELLRESTDNRIEHDDIGAIAYGLHQDSDELKSLVESCVEFGLFSADDHAFWSDGLNKRVERFLEAKTRVSEARKEAGRKGGLAKASKTKQGAGKAKQVSKVNISKSKLRESNSREEKQTLEQLGVNVPPEHRKHFAEAFEVNSIHINTGRCPLAKYSTIWLTPDELQIVFEAYRKAGLPGDRWGLAFQLVEAQNKKNLTGGKQLHTLDSFTALLGWALQRALEQSAQGLRVEREAEYLGRARA